MPRSQLVVFIALLVVLVIVGVGIFALSRSQAQVSVLPTVTMVASVTHTTSTPLPSATQVVTTPASTPTLNPTPHTPTDQPLGGSLQEVRQIMAAAPKTVGGLPMATDPMTTSSVESVMSVQNTDGTLYFITMSFGRSGKDFEKGINIIKSPPASYRVIDLADETLLLEGSSVLILMRYRNILVRLEHPDPRPTGPYPVPLTETQLIAIMTDLYTFLAQQ